MASGVIAWVSVKSKASCWPRDGLSGLAVWGLSVGRAAWGSGRLATASSSSSKSKSELREVSESVSSSEASCSASGSTSCSEAVRLAPPWLSSSSWSESDSWEALLIWEASWEVASDSDSSSSLGSPSWIQRTRRCHRLSFGSASCSSWGSCSAGWVDSKLSLSKASDSAVGSNSCSSISKTDTGAHWWSSSCLPSSVTSSASSNSTGASKSSSAASSTASSWDRAWFSWSSWLGSELSIISEARFTSLGSIVSTSANFTSVSLASSSGSAWLPVWLDSSLTSNTTGSSANASSGAATSSLALRLLTLCVIPCHQFCISRSILVGVNSGAPNWS